MALCIFLQHPSFPALCGETHQPLPCLVQWSFLFAWRFWQKRWEAKLCPPQQRAPFTQPSESTPWQLGAERGWVQFWMLSNIQAKQLPGHKQMLASLPWARTSWRGQGFLLFHSCIICFLQEQQTPPAISLRADARPPKRMGPPDVPLASGPPIPNQTRSTGWVVQQWADAAFSDPSDSTFLL